MARLYTWMDGLYMVPTLALTLSDARGCSQGGKDASDDVSELLRVPRIASQVEAWDAEHVRRSLRECGAWDAEELADDAENVRRLVWIACCDVAETPRFYR